MVTFRNLAATVLVFLSASATSAAQVDDYVFWKVVELVDTHCHYLKAIERRVISGLTLQALQSVPQTEHYNSGRTSSEEYDDWLTRTDGFAVAKAESVGCTAAAEPYLLKGRADASEAIYQDLVLAFHFNGLPKDDPAYQALANDQIQAVTGYDQFLQQVYGANFQAFVAAQRNAATQRLPQQSSGFDSFYDPLGIGLADPGPDYAALWGLQAAVRTTVREIQFEVYTEVAGYRIWPEQVGRTEIVAFHPNGSTEPSAHVISGPDSFDVVGGGTISAALMRMLGGELWLMSYGDEANIPATAGAAVALLIRTEPLAEGQSGYDAWSRRDWRTLTTRYDLTPVAASCLGGPCWKLPKAARDRLLEISAFEDVELWFAVDPLAKPDPESSSYTRGRLSHFRLHVVEGKPLT